MKMKNKDINKPVFLVVQHLRTGGIEVLALSLLDKLSGQREIHIVALEGAKAKAFEDWPVLHDYQSCLHFVNKKEGVSLFALLKLTALFLRYRPVAVHTHHIGPMIYGGIAARLCAVRNLIHTEHDGWHLQKNAQLQSRMMKWLKPTMIAVAWHVGQCVAKQCTTKMPHIVHNGIDTKHFSPSHKMLARFCQYLPQAPRIIGCAGRLEEVKGQRYLINALQYLPEDVHVAFAGDGSLKEDLKSYTNDLNLSHRVHFLGHVNHMRGFYCALDVFCLPSLNEGFPLSPLEAQACGTPSVLSNVGGCAEALCPDTGFLAEAGNVEELADKLLMALERKQDQSPRQFVLEHFDLSEMAARYDELYVSSAQQDAQPTTIITGEMSHV
ncbi:MAG: glycosyl transferase [Alphaproteobacteria bacterium]|nr:MAG: glycosyl transferase [Alphaproteobacteria bacterium]